MGLAVTEPWGISGPQFEVAYLVALAATTLLSLVMRSRVGSGVRAASGPPLTADQVAYLRGDRKLDGDGRVVATNVANLVERGILRMSRDGRLGLAGGGQLRTPLEAAIVNQVQQDPDRSWIRLVRTTTTITDRIRDELIGRRLLVRSGYAVVLLTALPVLVVTVVGLVRLVNGFLLRRPIEALAWSHVLTFLCLVQVLSRIPVRRSGAGERLVRAEAAVPLPGTGGLVAVHGPAAFPDREIASAFSRSAKPLAKSRLAFIGGSSDTSFSSSTSSGGGSSCGG
jgi:uncharacterized protein (TIGR04222 family)